MKPIIYLNDDLSNKFYEQLQKDAASLARLEIMINHYKLYINLLMETWSSLTQVGENNNALFTQKYEAELYLVSLEKEYKQVQSKIQARV